MKQVTWDYMISQLPKLYATENAPAEEKDLKWLIRIPGCTWEWYPVEFEPATDAEDNSVFFGLVKGFENEWGYFTKEELSYSGAQVYALEEKMVLV